MDRSKIVGARAPALVIPDRIDGTDKVRKETTQQTFAESSPSSLTSARLRASLSEKSISNVVQNKDEYQSNTSDNIEKLRNTIYREGRFYQGTTKSEVDRWRNTDMDPNLKQTTSMVKRVKQMPWFLKPLGWIEIRRSMKRLYFTQDKRARTSDDRQNVGAPLFASMKATPIDPAKISRSFFSPPTREELKIKDDPSSGAGVETGQIIPQGYTLQSKDTAPTITAASEAFKKEFNTSTLRPSLRIDTTITSEQAAQMLHEAQTPSTTDEFPPLKGIYASADYRNTGDK